MFNCLPMPMFGLSITNFLPFLAVKDAVMEATNRRPSTKFRPKFGHCRHSLVLSHVYQTYYQLSLAIIRTVHTRVSTS